MTGKRKRQIVPGNSAAIIGHPDQFDSALGKLHGYFGCSRIQAVLQQLLECRGRALHYLASGNLIDEQVGK